MGFQWVDGSFVENKTPKDADVVTFVRRPRAASLIAQVLMLRHANPEVFDRDRVKATYRLDAFFVDLDGTSEAIVDTASYWFGLFSHRRGDDAWKGMLRVNLDDVLDDQSARQLVANKAASFAVAVPPVGAP